MKTLRVWVMVLVMLAVCAPSFGYILVYNTISRVKAVDSDDSTLVGVAVRGYMVMDINDVNGDIDNSYWLIYGRDGDGAKVYAENGIDPELSVNGKYQSVSMDTPEGWVVIVVGKITNKDIGLADRKPVAYTMSGNFTIPGGFVLDTSFLTGSGAMSITLNSMKTKAVNQVSGTIDDALYDITDVLDLTYVGL